MAKPIPKRVRSGMISVRDTSLFVEVVGHGAPLVLMHGGPSADLWTLLAFRQLADQFTLIFYDHRCNGRSVGSPVASMTWENLAADADALRQELGFDRWAMLGHSFGGQVALEYALRYRGRLSHLILLDTGAEGRWLQENAPGLLARQGHSAKQVELARRWFNGEFSPREYFPIFVRIGSAYCHGNYLWLTVRDAMRGAWRSKMRPEAMIFAGRELWKGWTVMDRLAEISVPTLVMAGRQDFVFPPECQEQLAAAIPGAQLKLIDQAGHDPHSEQPAQVMQAVRDFMSTHGSAS